MQGVGWRAQPVNGLCRAFRTVADRRSPYTPDWKKSKVDPVHAFQHSDSPSLRSNRFKEGEQALLWVFTLLCSLVRLHAPQSDLRARSRPPCTAGPPSLPRTMTSWSARWTYAPASRSRAPGMSIAPACDSAPCSPTQHARCSAAHCLSHRCRMRPFQRAGRPELTKLLHERLILAMQKPAARQARQRGLLRNAQRTRVFLLGKGRTALAKPRHRPPWHRLGGR